MKLISCISLLIVFCIDDLKNNSYVADKNNAIHMHQPVVPAMSDLLVDTSIIEGRILMNASDCYTCHAENKVLLGPSFTDIAAKYKNEKSPTANLVDKVIEGSKGVWGDKAMTPHPELLREDAEKMIEYILHLKKKEAPKDKLPSKGK